MLTAQNITYRIDDSVLLKDISVSFEPGNLSLVIGPNGAGKSTLVKVLSRRLQPAEGQIRYGERPLDRFTDLELAQTRAVLSQHIELAFPLDVWQVVMMGRYPHFGSKPGPRDKEACEKALRFFDALEFSSRDYLTLSGGEKQRVNFARVLAQLWYERSDGFSCLMLDEPLASLDIKYQFSFMHKVKGLLSRCDLMAIGVVHDLNIAARFADHLVLLNNGKKVAQGTAKEVLTTENIRRTFRIESTIRKDDKTDSMYLLFN